jgi:tripartite ATP-independent transporter DctM subunit
MIAGAAGVSVFFLFLGVPIFIVFAIFGELLLGVHMGIPWIVIAQGMYNAVAKYMLIAVPLFIFSGNLMLEGGLAKRLVDLFTSYVGHFRGGLALSLVLTMGFFGALCGSILAAIVAIGTIMIPMMVERGYPKAFCAALVAASAGLDSLIPPSNGAIIYCSITGASVSKAFMAGLIPGIFQMTLLVIGSMWLCRKMQPAKPSSWRDRWKATFKGIPVLFMPIVILGGIYLGIFTPVEAAAIACVWPLVVGTVLYRELTIKGIWGALKRTASATGIVFALIATASFLSLALTYTRLPQKLVQVVTAAGVTPIHLLLLSALVWIALGLVLEAVPNLFVTVPIIMVLAESMGVDLLHLYLVMAAFIGIGLLTPPVCIGAYTAAAVAEEDVRHVLYYLYPVLFGILIVCGLVYIFFPEIGLWLPRQMG